MDPGDRAAYLLCHYAKIAAGLRKGDIILGVNGETSTSLPDFYRKIWAQGVAGVDVPLDVLQNHERRRVDVHSINRLDQLKLKTSF